MRSRVLIVDDIQINLDVLVGMLRHEHDCVTAISGPQALEALQAGPLPDIVLLDVMMPGMSGYEVHAVLRDTPAWRAIPVIYVTARNDPQSESQALGNGAVDFIHKPVNKEVLRARVRLHLMLEQQRRAVRENEERMRLAAQAAHFGVLDYDLVRGTSYWSIETRRIFGLAADQPVSPPGEVPPVVHPDDVSLVREAHARAIDPAGSGELESKHRVIRPDGTLRWVQCSGRTQFEGDGPARRAVRMHGVFLDVTAQEQARQQIDFLAFHDPLTSLPNRVLGLERLQQAIGSASRHQSQIALLYLDLDKFKYVNDTHGHALGDLLLKSVARRLAGCLRAEDTLFRLSGDEFMIVLANVKGANQVTNACERILKRHVEPFDLDGIQILTSFCVGAVLYPQDGMSGEMLMRNADMALYEAKKSGPNAFRFFEPQMNANLVQYVRTREALTQAIERQEFELHYQPQVSLADNRVVGVEALIRWRRPGHGLLPPVSFIAAAEETGLIVPIGRWVLQEACRQAARWQACGLPRLTMAVNLSAMQFRQGIVEADVREALSATGLDPTLLELELTESILLQSDDMVTSLLRRWKQQGIRLTIDDFGTGYSSLAYLKRLAVDKLKIDRSFVMNLHDDEQDRAIVLAMLQIARSLSLVTVAEGIEEPEVASRLHDMGCDEVQGYLYARPEPAPVFEQWLRERTGLPTAVVAGQPLSTPP
ncbi:MAG: putative bifunctional diguanylate cyclase/phosphodiesterase [Rubrivivax sp.]